MNKELLLPEIQRWIVENTNSDAGKLAFSKNPFPQIEYRELLHQVATRAKAKHKLPTWFANEQVIFPSKISLEQTSSEQTAEYKSNLVSGEKLIDLTGGFGVDDLYFSKKVTSVVHCEMNAELSQIAAHNFEVLKAENINCESGNSEEILRKSDADFDWIYVDPSRRNDDKGKVFMLVDCLPNVPESLDFYFSKSDNILVKTAPLLDISAGLKELRNVAEIHIVALENEVKELLFLLRKGFESDIQVKCVNLLKDKIQTFEFFASEIEIESRFSEPKKFLYEPNSSIYKSGAFDLVGRRFGLEKLDRHSHLYTSDELVSEFPGRIFEVGKVIAYGKSEMKENLHGKKANVSVRNFPESVEKLRAKWKIQDGGSLYTFFTTVNSKDKIVLLCAKI
ncbi:class I SAM-dependent methyltransferase [Flavobacterium sp.]|uniref:THUMP-like domain-containing protein n=1 Tax=Flavobacterium sp. TaxID=239 RepID=UPI00121F7864|nr:class I SAM-dependent methyltransferase [Flavobacterium sp.]RZJ72813.1 MAG: class I SAM-dependent methyltransferase [Flavobacterium sp.]